MILTVSVQTELHIYERFQKSILLIGLQSQSLNFYKEGNKYSCRIPATACWRSLSRRREINLPILLMLIPVYYFLDDFEYKETFFIHYMTN